MAGAEGIYRRALLVNTDWAEGWYRLGVVCLKQKKPLDAISHFDHCRELNHRLAETWNFQGIALEWITRTEDAELAFRQSIALAPQFGYAYLNLGIALRKRGEISEAEEVLSKAVAIEPTNLSALQNLSAVYSSKGQPFKAMECLQTLLQIQPRHVPSIVSISSIWLDLGRAVDAERGFQLAIEIAPNFVEAHIGLVVLQAYHKRFEEAVGSFERAIEVDANSVQAFYNLGNAQRELGRLQDAALSLQRAIELDPENALAHLNMGTLRFDQTDLEMAKYHYMRSLKISHQNAGSQMGMGAVLAEQGSIDDAEKYYHQALEIDPRSAQTHHNLSLVQLTKGNWEEGFKSFEWRWHTSTFENRNFKQPIWNGEKLDNQTLLIYCEQGFGDTLQFCRYIQLVKERAADVVIETPPPLVPILSSCPGAERIVAVGDELPKFDFQAPLMSLARIFGTTPNSVPCTIPYLSAQPDRIEHWKNRLGSEPTFRLGIAWRGSPNYARDKERSVPLGWFAPLARIEGVKLISLHRGDTSDEIVSMKDQFAVVDFGNDLDRNGGAFMDTAAVMKNIDLVISVDSAAGHLAGALGLPVWLILSRVSDWRWMLDRTDTPWYPTMRLFRQTLTRDWTDVSERIESELRALVELKFSMARNSEFCMD